MADTIDYAQSGLDIQSARVDQAQKIPVKGDRPPYLLWGGIRVQTADAICVPESGMLSASIVSVGSDVRQGFDLKFDDGWFVLAEGERVPLLRTWRDPRYEDTITYPFMSRDGVLWFWNVYERRWPNGAVTEEKWTGNAGFWVEKIDDRRRLYHCSRGMVDSPDFSSLVVEITVASKWEAFRK